MDASAEFRDKYFALGFTFGLHGIVFLLFLEIIFSTQVKLPDSNKFENFDNAFDLGITTFSNMEGIKSSPCRSISYVSQNKKNIVSRVSDVTATDIPSAQTEQTDGELKNVLFKSAL